MRDVTRNCYESLMSDTWPRAAAVVDFGLDSVIHYGALQYAIKQGVTIEELDAVLGNGMKINALVSRFPRCSYKAEFKTAYDKIIETRVKLLKPYRLCMLYDCTIMEVISRPYIEEEEWIVKIRQPGNSETMRDSRVERLATVETICSCGHVWDAIVTDGRIKCPGCGSVFGTPFEGLEFQENG